MKILVLLLPVLSFDGYTALESKKCSSRPVEMCIIMEGTSNVDVDTGDQMNQIAKNISLSVPNGSTIFVSSLGDGVEELISFNKTTLDLSWIEKWPNRNEVKQFGDTLSALALNNELMKTFSANQYKLRSEIVILLVSDTSKLETVPSFLTKKKTFVVVLGSSVPSIFNSIASRRDHLFLVSNNDELESVVVRILKQVACDSNFCCDTDTYSVKRGSRCKPCSNLCGDDLTQQSLTCERRCPYIQQTSSIKVVELTSPSMLPDKKVESFYIEDNKEVVVPAVASGVVLVLFLIAVAVWCMVKKQEKPPLTPSPSDVTLQKTVILGYDKMPIEETGADVGAREEAPFLSDVGFDETDEHDQTLRKNDDETDEHDQTLRKNDDETDEHDQTLRKNECKASDDTTENGGNMLLPFADKRTMDLNNHYSGENVVFLHKSRGGERLMPINDQEEIEA